MKIFGGKVRHCCKFKAIDIYYLEETPLYTKRKLSVGFCPICSKPVSELCETRFDGKIEFISCIGIKANDLVLEHQDEILYSVSQHNKNKLKSKPYGWKYGENKTVKIGGKEHIRQTACDFYGNKEIIKII